MSFTQEELQNLLTIINRTNISGAEATAVAILQQKITALMKPVEKKKDGSKQP